MNTNTDTDTEKDNDVNIKKDIGGYVYGSIDEFESKW